MSTNWFLNDELSTDSCKYFEEQRMRQILESIVAGITYNKPSDPLEYMECCIQKIRANELLSAQPTLRWDTFLPPIVLLSRNSRQDSIVVRKSKIGNTVLPRISTTHAHQSNEHQAPSLITEIGVQKRISIVLPPIQSATDRAFKDTSITTTPQITSRGQAWNNIVFVLGGPGSGKGTQCVRIAKEFNYTHLSAGDLLRNEVATGSSLGKQLDSMMKEGKIVPTDITLRLLTEAMETAPAAKGFLIDGFPRQLDQAEAFESKIARCRFVLYFECSESVLEQRLLERGKSSGRADDNMETIKKRFHTFVETSYPVIEFFKNAGRCFKISSEQSPDEVYDEVQQCFVDPPLYHPNIVFILGGPGSGKGTQCERLVKEFQLTHLSAGDLLRGEVERGTEVGILASELMKEGKIVPMDLILSLLRKEIEKNIASIGFLIDGFPRAMDQALEFEKTIGPCRAVLAFTCSLPVLEQRLLERGKTSGRADDNLDTIKKRFHTFNEQSLPVIEYYKSKGKCVEISSENAIDRVYDDARLVFIPPEPLHHPNLVFILGGPGSGKGTLCEKIVKEFDFIHISTGDLLRREIENKTAIGQLVEQCILVGAMAPSHIILELLIREIMGNFAAPGFLIDGFPRAMDQALNFERVVGSPKFVLFLECPLNILEKRLVERGRTSGRADDNIDTIRKRFITYHDESLPVIRYYTSKSIALKISSIRAPDEVFDQVKVNFAYMKTKQPFEGQLIIFVLGGPGSGKGTQCDRLVAKYGLTHLSTGDLLRDEVKKGSPLGAQLESDMTQGKMVSMEVIMKLLLAEMNQKKDGPGYLIDGFPRTIEQAHLFESVIGRCTFVLYFEASNEILTTRLLKRGETSGRADDNLESIGKRLVTFENASLPVIRYYERTNRVKKINSEAHVDEVTAKTVLLFEKNHTFSTTKDLQ
ncbi:hypothetical protein QVD99_001276 [Batrachochytrium dendrobatidis]|nr:hypothetical protein QVD99_001276 [Batrachochytrium dendrobatidis]